MRSKRLSQYGPSHCSTMILFQDPLSKDAHCYLMSYDYYPMDSHGVGKYKCTLEGHRRSSARSTHLLYLSPIVDMSEWNIKASNISKRAHNPIRQIVDKLKVDPNAQKSFISLSVGKHVASRGVLDLFDTCILYMYRRSYSIWQL